MFRILSGIFLFSLIVAGCQNASNDNYIIEGEFPGHIHENVSLMHQVGNDWKVLQITHLDKNGKFQFKGHLDFPEFVYINLVQDKKFVRFFLSNDPIEVVVKDSLFKDPQISGSPLQDKFEEYTRKNKQEFSDSLMHIYNRWKQAQAKGNANKMLVLDSLRGFYYKKQLAYQVSFIKDNSANVLGPFVLNLIYTKLTEKQLLNLASTFSPALNGSLYLKQIHYKIKVIQANKPGQPFIDFTLPDSTGKMYRLSDVAGQGRYLVINFWASWDGRSRLEYPQWKKVVEEYYSLGLETINVSLDTDRKQWIKFLDEYHLPGLQVSDLKGPRGDPPSDYQITGLPVRILVDPGGTIIARVKTVDELERELKSIFQ